MSLLLLFFPIMPSNAPYPNQSLHLELAQDKNGNIQVVNKSIENDYSADYKLVSPMNDRKIIIVGTDDSELFKGTFASKTRIIMEVLNDKNPKGDALTQPLEKIKLFVPVFPKAKEIQIKNSESGKTILSIPFDIKEYKVTRGYKMTCGNGICDPNEHMLSCFTDCRPYSVMMFGGFSK